MFNLKDIKEMLERLLNAGEIGYDDIILMLSEIIKGE